jgi:hypothetical protein
MGLHEKPKGWLQKFCRLLIARGFCFYLHRKCGRPDLSAARQQLRRICWQDLATGFSCERVSNAPVLPCLTSQTPDIAYTFRHGGIVQTLFGLVRLLTVTDDAAHPTMNTGCYAAAGRSGVWTARSQQRHINGSVESPATRLLHPRPAVSIRLHDRPRVVPMLLQNLSQFSGHLNEDALPQSE